MQMEGNIVGNGWMIRCMEKGSFSGQMAKTIKDPILMMKNRDLEWWGSLMDRFMRANGQGASNTAREDLLIKEVRRRKEFGKEEFFSDDLET